MRVVTDNSTSIRRKKSYKGNHFRRRTRTSLDQYHLDLTSIIGLTLKSNCAFACDPRSATPTIAYPAGCVLVIYCPVYGKQTHIRNGGNKPITCLGFSDDGAYIVTGESGHCPYVRVFCVAERSEVATFKSHMFGISCVAFSPNGRYIVSIGDQHDNVINVWEWKSKRLAASNKVSIEVQAMSFASDSSIFVTVGKSHVKFWYLLESTEAASSEGTVPLKGRSAILGSLHHQQLCDVSCDTDFTYALSRAGTLCMFHRGRIIEKSVQLETTAAFCLCVVAEMVFCGCSGGTIHVYSSRTLDFMTMISPSHGQSTSDVIAICMDGHNMWLHCMLNDHSMLSYDVLNIHAPKLHNLQNFHSKCVWDVKAVPNSSCFFTCSNDNSVRLWNADDSSLVHKLTVNTMLHMNESDDQRSGKVGVKCLSVRTDGRRLAVGDRQGNIHTFHLNEDYIPSKQLAIVKAHVGDILSLDYCDQNGVLASGSRDRCVHTWEDTHEPMHTIADHSGVVTSVKFVTHGEQISLMTCGADKSLYFCSMIQSEGKTEVTREQHVVTKHSMQDMAATDTTIIVACGTSLLEYDVATSRQQRVITGRNSSATILRVSVDNRKELIAVSCQDKYVYLLSYQNGDFVSVVCGHSETCTSLVFSDDCSNLVTTFADSCIFVWKIQKLVREDILKIVRGPELEDINSELNTMTPATSLGDITQYFGEVILNSSFMETNKDEQSDEKLTNEVSHASSSEIKKGNQVALPQTQYQEITNGITIEQRPSALKVESLSTVAESPLNVSLPSWMSGRMKNKDKTKIVKGKWASRLQKTVSSHGPECTCMFCAVRDDDGSQSEEEESSGSGCLLLETPRDENEWGISDSEQKESHENETNDEKKSGLPEGNIGDEENGKLKMNGLQEESKTVKVTGSCDLDAENKTVKTHIQAAVKKHDDNKSSDSGKLRSNIAVTKQLNSSDLNYLTTNDSSKSSDSAIEKVKQEEDSLQNYSLSQDTSNSSKSLNGSPHDETSEYHSAAHDLTDEEIDIRHVVHSRVKAESSDRPSSAPSTYVSKLSFVIESPTNVKKIPAAEQSHKSKHAVADDITNHELPTNDLLNLLDRKDSLKSTVSDTKVDYTKMNGVSKPAIHARSTSSVDQPTSPIDFFNKLLNSKAPSTPRSYNSNSNHSTPIKATPFPTTPRSIYSTPRNLSPKQLMNGFHESGDAKLTAANCNRVVTNLMDAYDHAEAMYKQASESGVERDRGDRKLPVKEAAMLQKSLERTFAALHDRIEQLQLDICTSTSTHHHDDDNQPEVARLLKDYSDKLFDMVRNEFQKQAIFDEE